MILKLALDLPEDGAYVALARQFGRGLLEYLRVVPDDIADVETIVAELVANVIRHARSEAGRFQVLLEYFADHVAITVTDSGLGFARHDLPPVGAPRPDAGGGERLGGFGLPLLELLSSRLEFTRTDPHGTTVRAEKRLHYRTPADSDRADDMNATGGGEATLTGE